MPVDALGRVTESSSVLLNSWSSSPSSSASSALSQPSGREVSIVFFIPVFMLPPIRQSSARLMLRVALRPELPPPSGVSRSPLTLAVRAPSLILTSITASPCRNWLASKSIFSPREESRLSTPDKVAVACNKLLLTVILIRSLLSTRVEERITSPPPASEATAASPPGLMLSITPLRSIARSLSGIAASSDAISAAMSKSSRSGIIVYTGSSTFRIFSPDASSITLFSYRYRPTTTPCSIILLLPSPPSENALLAYSCRYIADFS